MFCPRCGAQNIEDAKFCRGCGADIGLVPQALTGQMPEKRAVGYDAEGKPYDAEGRRIPKEGPKLDKAISTGFTGLAFLIVALVLAFTRTGGKWWFWMLIPAFTLLGGGLAEYVRYKQAEKKRAELPAETPRMAMPSTPSPPPRASALPPRNTAELVPPPSVTEGTTKHLDLKAEAPTRHIETPSKKSAKDI
jgi:hypothetical protein